MASSSSRNSLSLDFLQYRRPFARPLETARETWQVREGLLLRLEGASGAVSFGEIAPLPSFGSESLTEARQTLESMAGTCGEEAYRDLMERAGPATAFGLWTAQDGLAQPAPKSRVRTAGLLALGPEAPESIGALRKGGIRTFKVKVGLTETKREQEYLTSILETLQTGEKLRLDPNQAWEAATARDWFSFLEDSSEWIEYIEEPFLKGELIPSGWKADLPSPPAPLAIDESLTNDNLQGWIDGSWSGFWILKPSIQGLPEKWLSPLKAMQDRIILSSCFETGIGLSALIRMGEGLNQRDQGLGTQAFFDDPFGAVQSNGAFTALTREEQEAIWNGIPRT